MSTSSNLLESFVEDKLPLLKKGTIYVAGSLYLCSALASASYHNHQTMTLVARLLLYNACFLFIAGQTAKLVSQWKEHTNMSVVIYILETVGYLLLAAASTKEEAYNRGALFMVGSFTISIAKEFGIVMLLVPENTVNQRWYLFLSILNSCCGALMFFFGALIAQMGIESQQSQVLSSSLNIFSGILMVASVFYTSKLSQYEGYKGLDMALTD